MATKNKRKHNSVPKIPKNQKYLGVFLITVAHSTRFSLQVVGTATQLQRLQTAVYRKCEKTGNIHESFHGGSFPYSPSEALELVNQIVHQHGIPNDKYLDPLARRIMNFLDGKTNVSVISTPEDERAHEKT
jgi:hypothetical protein